MLPAAPVTATRMGDFMERSASGMRVAVVCAHDRSFDRLPQPSRTRFPSGKPPQREVCLVTFPTRPDRSDVAASNCLDETGPALLSDGIETIQDRRGGGNCRLPLCDRPGDLLRKPDAALR